MYINITEEVLSNIAFGIRLGCFPKCEAERETQGGYRADARYLGVMFYS